MIIGSRLKDARLKKKLSQEQVGKLLGVSKVSVCGYEKGTRTPTMDNFLSLLEIYDLDPNYVLGRDMIVINENNSGYKVLIAEEDLEILATLKKQENCELYNKLCDDPKRTIDLINRKVIK